MTAIVAFAITRNSRGCASCQDDKLANPERRGTTTVNMTKSDAYGMVEMPAQLHNYEYVTPKP